MSRAEYSETEMIKKCTLFIINNNRKSIEMKKSERIIYIIFCMLLGLPMQSQPRHVRGDVYTNSVNQASSNSSAHKNKSPIEVDHSITGKILCGYQGWFNAAGDGSDLDWKHYSNGGIFAPGKCSIDLWPDVSEYGCDQLYETSFKNADGSAAKVFSSADAETVDLHFKWMEDYGIDGVFVQRFISNTTNAKLHRNMNKVYDNCFTGSVVHQRLLSVMYDLSGSKRDVVANTKRDWKMLVDKYQVNDAEKTNILTHKGKAVVAIWGAGFSDREYTLNDIIELIRFFKTDPVYGNCSVLLGVPTGWRNLERDCISDTLVHEAIKLADIVHPWTPGRYNSLDGVDKHNVSYTLEDKEWCDKNNLAYMPVVFPGFSWYNLKNGEAPLNAIPRLKGDFFWRQLYNAISAKTEMIYVAMFDEMDEGTCIFKCADNPPVGTSPFATYEGLPSDYYLWLTGKATQMLKKEMPLSVEKPAYK